MKFVKYELVYTTWGTWTRGLLVKDLMTITLENELTGELYTTTTTVNYSSMGYGRMVVEPFCRLNERMLDKHVQYMEKVDIFRDKVVVPILDWLMGGDFKDINHFLKVYNNTDMEDVIK